MLRVGLFLLTATAVLTQQNAQELDCGRQLRGSSGKAQVVKNTSQFRLNDYTMEDVKFVPLSLKSGLLVYKVTETGTSHGIRCHITITY